MLRRFPIPVSRHFRCVAGCECRVLKTCCGILRRFQILFRCLVCVAVCCSVLQCVAVCAENVLWNVEALSNSSLAPLQVFSVRCSALQCVAVCCWVTCCGILRRFPILFRCLVCVAVCCSVLQCVAMCAENVLWNVEALSHSNLAPFQVFSAYQCVAVCCSVLQGVSGCGKVLHWLC